MATLKGPGGTSISDQATYQGRMDATALLAGKMVEALDGNSNPIWEHMQVMMDDPERLGAACLSILNLFFAWATQNGSDVKPIDLIIKWNISQLKQDSVKFDIEVER